MKRLIFYATVVILLCICNLAYAVSSIMAVENETVVLTNKSLIPVGVSCTILIFFGTLVWKLASDRQSILNELNNQRKEIQELKEQIKNVKQSSSS